MLKINFPDEVPENIKMPYVIIVSRYKGRWVFVQHKDRSTYEMPAVILNRGRHYFCCKRELYEETGAADFSHSPCIRLHRHCRRQYFRRILIFC